MSDGRQPKGSPLGAFALLGAVLVLDGYDVQAMGYVAPALVRDWGLESARMGPVFGAGLLGLFLGSFLFAIAADRVGRRPALLVATLVLGGFTLAAAWSTSLGGLALARFASGLGLGGIMPNATALVGELAPPRRRIATMMIVTNGFLVGAMAGGLASAWLIPAYGWRAVLVLGGALPLALLAPLWRWLPESPAFLAGRAERGAPLAALLRGGRGPATALLWGANFLNVLVAYLVASWLPAVLRDAGRDGGTAVLVGTAVQAGGAVGTVVVGLVLERAGFVPVLTGCFAAAAAGLTLVASPGLPVPALFGLAAVVGWGVFAGQPGLNALAATLYPAGQRSTGIGAALGIGRLGAVLGPVLAGALLARGWDGEALFRATAVPAAGTALVVLALGRLLPPRQGEGRVTR